MPPSITASWTLVTWLVLVERELLLFALFWFLLGTIDEAAMDCTWFWLRLNGRARTERLGENLRCDTLITPTAVLIPAWHEAEVIGTTVSHLLAAWPQDNLRVYVGCYGNDPASLAAAMLGAGADARVRMVVVAHAGPTTKADCLNRLYAAVCADEARGGGRCGAIVLQDAEDMVHPLGLAVIDRALEAADFVQLPVRPEIPGETSWIAGHYADEFTESHAKTLVVRGALGTALPAAGVGCGFARGMLDQIGAIRVAAGETGPFAAECLTEDYELGMLIARCGGRSRFVRMRDPAGHLIATRSYFPATLPAAVRQKTRWIHGTALQGWDRLGWQRDLLEIWMGLRDRRGPLTAMVLACAYLLLVVEAMLDVASRFGAIALPPLSQGIEVMIRLSIAGLIWRAAMRAGFTAREYGRREGVRALLRIPIANVITIMAGRRALGAYLVSLRSGGVVWEKTAHLLHPARTLRHPADPAAARGAIILPHLYPVSGAAAR